MRDSGLRLFRALARAAIAHPILALSSVALVSLISAPGIWRLKLRTDGHALLTENAPEVVCDQAIRQRFGIDDNIVALVTSHDPNGIYNRATLGLVRDLTAEFKGLPGVDPSAVISLATEPGLHFTSGWGENLGLIEPALSDPDGPARLRKDLAGIEIYTGTLVSTDGTCAAILVGIPPGLNREQFYEEILGAIGKHRDGTNTIAVTGAPVAESLLGLHILEDLGVPQAWLGTAARSANSGERSRVGLVPIAALVMMLVLLASFRNLVAALLPLPGVAAVLLFVFGWMGWTGTPIYLTMAILPVLLTVLSVTNDIYLFNRYFALVQARAGESPQQLLKETFDSLVWPVAATVLTAAAGFFSFAFSPLVPVRAFGLFAGLGALFGLVFSFTAVPALLVLIPPTWLISRRAPVSRLGTGFASLGNLAVRRRWWIVGAALAFTLVAPFGVRRLAVQDSWIGGFDPESDFRKVTELVNQKFFGIHQLYVSFDDPGTLTGVVDAGDLQPTLMALPGQEVPEPILISGSAITLSVANPPAVWHAEIDAAGQVRDGRVFVRLAGTQAPAGFWEALSRAGQARYEIPVRNQVRPDIVRSVGELGAFIRARSRYAVGGTLGPWEYLTTTRFMSRPQDPAARQLEYTLPELNLLWHHYAMGVGPRRFSQTVDTNYQSSLTTVFLKDANFKDTASLMADIRAYERENLSGQGIKLRFAGDVAASQSLIGGIVSTQLRSLAWSLAGIFIVTAVMGGSTRWGFYCLLPSAWAVLIKFAVMGWMDIPLGVATSMFAAMTLGLGVNCAIHLLEGMRQAQTSGTPVEETLGRAMASTGPPALINTLAISLGFGTLLASHVPANARLGLLLALSLAVCFIASMLVLPVLLSRSARAQS